MKVPLLMPAPVAHAPSSTSSNPILDCNIYGKNNLPCTINGFLSYLLSKSTGLVDEGA